MNRRNLLSASLAGLGLVAVAATTMAFAPAAGPAPVAFDRAAFEQAQAADKRILIDVYAPWCPTCRAQEPIIDRVAGARGNENLVVFRVDFDGQKAEVRRFGAQRQSTLIAYRGSRETGRLVGDTNPDRIAALVATTR
jgi:thioredoxin 1